MMCWILMVASNVTSGNAACKARASLRPWVGPLKKSGSPKEIWVAPSPTCCRMSSITTSAGTMRNFPWYTGTTGRSVRQHQVGVAGEFGQAAAVRHHERDLAQADDRFALDHRRSIGPQSLAKGN